MARWTTHLPATLTAGRCLPAIAEPGKPGQVRGVHELMLSLQGAFGQDGKWTLPLRRLFQAPELQNFPQSGIPTPTFHSTGAALRAARLAMQLPRFYYATAGSRLPEGDMKQQLQMFPNNLERSKKRNMEQDCQPT